MADVEVTEFIEIDPDELHLVGKGANGFKALLAKSADEEVRAVLDTIAEATDTEIEKADDDAADKRPDCTTCNGSGKIMDGHRKCPDCKGSGVKPQPGDTEKSLAKLAARKESGVAASGADVPVDPQCPACKGSGEDETGQCDACGGTGENADAPAPSDLNAVDGDPGKITVGAGGRESVDKGADDLEKKNVDPNVGGGVDRDKLDDSDFAGKNRSFPIVKPGDVSDAASSIGRAGPDNYSSDKLKANIIAIAKRKGASFVAELPKAWTDAAKAAGDVFTAPNPALSDAASQVTDVDPDTTDPMAPPATPGSPAWEAVDAQTATDAALALMTAVELMRTFASRESTEVAMGQGNDVFDAYAATEAICAAQQALGIVAQLAFHEGLEAAKSLPDDESIEKAGRRLAGKTVAALAAARDKAKDLADHIGGVLGDDDPKKNGAANKSAEIDMDALSKELENMSTDELTKVLDARDEKLVGILAEALKGVAPAPVADAPKAKKTKAAKAEAETAEAEGDEVTDPAEKAEGDDAEAPEEAEVAAAKAELTPEEIEANEAAAAAKKEAKRLRKAAEQTAADAATAKAIEEAVAKATAAVDSLKDELAAAKQATDDRLATVEKMAAPSNIVRTAPTDAQNVAKARDETELRIATLENEARSTSDPAIRSGNREIIKELRAELAAKN